MALVVRSCESAPIFNGDWHGKEVMERNGGARVDGGG